MSAEAPGTDSLHREVVVIGGGQAGLAIGYFLAQQGRRFAILEAAGEPAAAWRTRWDSLKLFTPVRYDSLPGLTFPGDPDGYPGREDVVAYLTDYAQRFELPVELNSRVPLRARTRRRLPRRARRPDVPSRPGRGRHRAVPGPVHPRDSRRPHQRGRAAAQQRLPVAGDLPAGTVLVVGGGNTGFQIAAELAQSRELHLAVGARQTPLPQRIFGRDLFRYLAATGLMSKTVTSRLGQRLKDRETLIGSSPRSARRQGIRMRPRATAAHGTTVTFADGSEVTVDAVVWATGFRLDHSFVELPVFDERGQLKHERGVTDVSGLYFLGLPWQHTRGSALLGWVKDDAQFVAQRIGASARPKPRADPAPTVLSGPPPA